MSQVKAAIGLVCDAIMKFGCSGICPEDFRLSKFNQDVSVLFSSEIFSLYLNFNLVIVLTFLFSDNKNDSIVARLGSH